MRNLALAAMMALASAASAINYELDSVIECISVSSYEVEDWETVHVYMGRAHTDVISPNDRCAIKLYAEYGSKLQIEVERSTFDNSNIKVKILDGSYSYSSTLATLDRYNGGWSTYYSTQRYVYIVVDKTSCLTTTCRNGLNVDLKVTIYDDYLSTGSIIGIVIGALIGLGLLIGVPICICCCCCAAAASGGSRRHGPNITTVTTTAGAVNQPYLPATTAYPQQQYVFQGQNAAGYQQQPLYNPQAAPPAYPGVDQYPQQQYGFANEAKEGTPAL